jgi:hypothetical protein
MRELPEQRFDAAITRTLKFDTLLPTIQQQSAKERLLRRAVVQTVLPPLAIERPATLRDHASVIGQRTLRLLNLLIMDSSAYERARRPPLFYQFYNAHGRYAFTIINMSA